MNRSLLLLLFLLGAQQALALSAGEETALGALLTNIPSLGLASPPWTSNVSLACGSPGFYGIACSSAGEPHVISLNFDIDMLNGSFPREVSGLTWLETLNISRACFSSWQLEELSSLTELRTLSVSNVRSLRCRPESDTTYLPAPLSALKKLETLAVSVPGLTGSLSEELGNLTSLRVLRLTYPSLPAKAPLRGSIPASIVNCQQLEILEFDGVLIADNEENLTYNFSKLREFTIAHNIKFYTSIQRLLEGSPELRKIDISYSAALLSATLFPFVPHLQTLILDGVRQAVYIGDTFWPNLTSLEYFSANLAESIAGTIKPSIQALKKLKYFDISHTSISGPLPPEIGHCDQLEVLLMQESYLSGTLPASIGQLTKLRRLRLVNFFGYGELPESLGQLQALEELILSGSGFNGTIPSGLSTMENLTFLDLHGNGFSGTIPELAAKRQLYIDLHENDFTGTIPSSIARYASHLDLRNNNLGPELAEDLFAETPTVLHFDLSHNRFKAPLPHFSGSPPKFMENMRLSYNEFYGTIPRSYCRLKAPLFLDHNTLNGTLDNLFDDDCGSLITQLDISENEISGTIPSLRHTILYELFASSNELTGDLPEISASLRNLDLSKNKLLPSVYNMNVWSQFAGELERLDLSHNGISVPVSYTLLITPKLTHLSVAYNWFLSANTPPANTTVLVSLDLESCQLREHFEASYFPRLTTLRLASNNFIGAIAISHMPELTYLDISHNRFQFDVEIFTRLPSLRNIKANTNALFGTLVLNEMPSLQEADFSDNDFRFAPDLVSIGRLFHSYSLNLFNITSNKNMRHISDFNTNATGLARTLTSTPSDLAPKLFKCFSLDFFHRGATSFLFDEPLFNYRQCDCDENHFGLPPYDCFECPKSGVSDCGGLDANVKAGYAALWHETKVETAPSNQTDPSAPTSLSPTPTIPTDDVPTKNFLLSTESCLYTTIHTLTKRSNCNGVNISAEAIAKHNNSIDLLLRTQCSPGSEGRMCSKCICSAENGRDCYFEKGPVCAKCKSVMRPRQSIPMLVGILLLVVVVLSTVLLLVLRSKRRPDMRAWKELPPLKRIFYRLLFITTLGNLSVLVTFLQILLEFTQWGAYIQISFLGVINGDVEGFGLRCIFPFLADPMAAHLLRLSIPFLVILLTVASVGIAAAILNALERVNRSSPIPHTNDISDAEDASLLEDKPKRAYVAYPTLALLTSTSITLLKFFYFGTALSAHEYIFSTLQYATGIKFVLNKPWMLFRDAHNLIMASIPTIVIFDALIPLLFIFICWKYRHSFYTPTAQIYFGSLFSSFARRCFWWELVNTFKKLSIALVLQAIPADNALQSALIISILGANLVAIVLLQPWRRKTENVSDVISSLILIGALLSTRPVQLLYTNVVSYYIATLAAAFALLSLGLILYHTLTAATDHEDRLSQRFGSFELGPQRVSKVDQLLAGWATEVQIDDPFPHADSGIPDPSDNELLTLDT